MAFSDMDDVEQELGEEKPPSKSGNRTFLIIAGVLGGIMVLALLCIAGLALFRYLPNQRADQSAKETSTAQSVMVANAAQATASSIAASQTAAAHPPTATLQPTVIPTNTRVPTNTPVIVLGPSKTPTVDIAVATRNALLTQAVRTQAAQTLAAQTTAVQTTAVQATTVQATATPAKPASTVLPETGIADELGTPGLLAAAFVLVVIIFLVRRLRTAS